MSADTIVVRAIIRLLATSEGGRSTPLKGGTSYRPNHNFLDPENKHMVVGFVDLPDGADVNPGESIEVQLMFWNAPGLSDQIYPGREWRIQEGPKLVATGTVLEVLPTS